VISPWQYGFGECDTNQGKVKDFQALPYFSGSAWQGGSGWPDPKLGWVQLTAEGGHAGNDLKHAAVRRWVSPMEGEVRISGAVRHEHKEGDGIRAFIVSSRKGLLGAWTLQDNKADANVPSVKVNAGDTVDFVVDLREGLNSDMFKWSPVIKVLNAGDYSREWNAKKDFGGPPIAPPEPLTAWEQYAQVLLLSNELLFVD
jgi:hypothetical protein